MGKWSKKVTVNQIRNHEKKNNPNEKLLTNRQIHQGEQLLKCADKQVDRDFAKVEKITKAYHLLFTMMVLRKSFKFTPSKLLVFCQKWRSFYESMYFKDGAKMSNIYATITGTNKNEGELSFTDYELNKFDEDKKEFDRTPGETNYVRLLNYRTKETSVGCMNAAEGAAMITLFDYFGFAKVRLKRFIQHVRSLYKVDVQGQMAFITYLEEVLAERVAEFDVIRDPNKKILTTAG